MFSVIPDKILQELNAFWGDVSHLTPDELTALSFCLIEGSISNQRLQYVLNMHSVDVTGLLKKLCVAGYLESDNNGRWAVYKIKEKVATPDEKVATSPIDIFRGKSLKPEELEKVILSICRDNYIKKDELAQLLGKSENYLRNKILPNLLKAGKLEKRYPYTHNHPEQGYKTREEYVENPGL